MALAGDGSNENDMGARDGPTEVEGVWEVRNVAIADDATIVGDEGSCKTDRKAVEDA